jgi:cytochrome-b5 reductase
LSIAHILGIPDGASSWSSWISNLWTRGQPKAGDIDIRKKNVLVLVCGPEPYVLRYLPRPHVLIKVSMFSMVAAIAGPYGRNHSQGKVGGVLAELGFKAGQVWKL